MVTIGNLTWVAKVEGAQRAQQKADQVSESMGDAEEKAQGVNSALGGTSDRLSSVSDASSRTSNRFGRLGAMSGLLQSALLFLGSAIGGLLLKFGGISAIAGAISGAFSTIAGWVIAAWTAVGGLSGIFSILAGVVSTVIGWITGLVSAVVGSTAGLIALGVAIGTILGLFAVWILKITGVLDWVHELGATFADLLPGWVRDGLLAVLSIFGGVLAVLGGFITGFIDGFVEGGLVQGIQEGVDRALEVAKVFADAWGRLWERGIENVTKLFDGFGAALANAVKGTFNALIPSQVSIPEIQIGGGEVLGQDIPQITIGGGAIDLPQLQAGGMIRETGAFIGHAGEMVVPADVTRNIQAEPAATGGDGGVSIDTVNVDIGDQSLNVDNLTRLELEELAGMIARELGTEVENII